MTGGVALFGAEAPTESKPERHANKDGYTLLNPTPSSLLRELSADRPDKTDSPFTVDAGHFQIEADAVSFSYDRYNAGHSRQRFTAWEAASMNLKAGLLNNLDAQLVVVSYRRERLADLSAHRVERNSGFGDITPRLKYNIWGNDGGKTALGIMPFVKLPTAHAALGNHEVEGGVKLPFAIEVPNWDVSMMTEVDWIHDDIGTGYHPEFINTISVGRSIVGDLAFYVEFFSGVSTEASGDWEGTLDTWFTYQLNKDLRLDAGVYIGLTRAAEDWHPFLGVTWRY